MNKFNLLVIAFLIFPIFIHAQEWIIEPVYDNIQIPSLDQSYAFIKVEQEGQVSCLDQDGNIISAMHYDDIIIEPWSGYNLLKVKKDGLWGLINLQGGIVLNIEHEEIKSPNISSYITTIKKDGFWGVFNFKEQKMVCPTQYKSIDIGLKYYAKWWIIEDQNGYGVMSPKGEIILPATYHRIIPDNLGDGICVQRKSDKKYAYFNLEGEAITGFRYDRGTLFCNNKAAVEENGLFGYIDITGREIIPLQYQYADIFWDDYAFVKQNGQYFFVDQSNKRADDNTYDKLTDFDTYNKYYIAIQNGKYGFASSTTGKPVGEIKYDQVWKFEDGMARFLLDGKYGYLDKEGKEVVPAQYSIAHSFPLTGYYAKVKKDGKWGLINEFGQTICPPIYDEVKGGSPSGGGTFPFKQDGKWGYAELGGKVVQEAQYDDCAHFYAGYASVKKGDKWGLVNWNGNTIIDFIADAPIKVRKIGIFIKKDGKWGLMRSIR